MPVFFALVLAFLIGVQLNGQPRETYRYQELTVSDGLPDPTVTRITQDKRGYIWLATLNGIARYDGNRTRNYHPSKEMDPEATNRDFPYLHVSDSGNLWLGYLFGKHGLFRYDESRDSFLHFDAFAGTAFADSTLSIRAIYEEPDKYLWVADSRRGIFKFDLTNQAGDTLSYRHYHQEATGGGLPTNFMAPGLWRDPSGHVWILTEAGLVEYHSSPDKFITHQWSDIPLENEGISFAPDTLSNCLWIGTFNGLVRFDLHTKRAKRFQFAPGAPVNNSPNIIPVVNLDKKGRPWVTKGWDTFSTLWIFDTEEEKFYPVIANDLNKYEQLPGALNLYTDFNGITWSGNFRRGVQAINPVAGNVRRVMLSSIADTSESFDESGILAMAEYSPGIFFIGTVAQGVWRWDRNQSSLARVKIPGLDAAVDSVAVNDLALSRELNLFWVITSNAIYEYHIPTGKSRLLKALASAPGKTNYRHGSYGDGWLWGGSLGQGAYRLKAGATEEAEHFSIHNSDSLTGYLPYGGISAIKPGVEPGQFWLASVYGGLLEWHPKLSEFLPHPTQRDIRHILIAPDGLLWLASPGGIRLYDSHTKKNIPLPPETGEALAHPLSISRGLDGTIWVGTGEGIVGVNEKERSVSHQFAASTWLKDKDRWNTTLHTSLSTSNGDMYFANTTGLFVVDPDDILYDAIPPRVALQSFAINGRKQPLPALPAGELLLDDENNHLDFTVAVLHFLSPAENRFTYLLEGADTDWKTTSPETVLAYHDLGPGTYRLLARGISSDGTIGAVQELVNVRIGSVWYATSWAYFLYLILLLSIGFGWLWTIVGRKDEELQVSSQPAGKKKEEHVFMLTARKAVLENLTEREFGPDQMAEALSLSRSQLHRRLDKLGGISTTHFINATRLAEAKEKLADPTFTIAEIAYDCGYSDPSYFSRKFREFYGMSPTEYREQS